MKRVLRRMAVCGGLLLAVADPTIAGQATTTFNVTANIVAACSASAPDLAFGTYSAQSGAALTGQTNINVSCTSGSTFTVLLSVGTASGSTFTTRHLANGASLLNYNLYTSAAATTVWGDGTGATTTVAGTGTGLLTPTAKTVYGVIPISQDLPAGSYSSQITVTVNY